MCSSRSASSLPLAFKRGYHRHFRSAGNAGLTRPVVDTDYGYVSRRWSRASGSPPAPNSPVATMRRRRMQFDRLMPAARGLFPLGEPIEAEPWLGSRPCFADSRPVIGRAPGQPGLWLDYGHGHWGLTLGPASGRLIAEMMTGDRAVLRSGALFRGTVRCLSGQLAELVVPARQRAGEGQRGAS